MEKCYFSGLFAEIWTLRLDESHRIWLEKTGGKLCANCGKPSLTMMCNACYWKVREEMHKAGRG